MTHKTQPEDEFAELPISNQAKWARRNPDKVKATRKKYYATEEGRERILKRNREYYRKKKNKINEGENI